MSAGTTHAHPGEPIAPRDILYGDLVRVETPDGAIESRASDDGALGIQWPRGGADHDRVSLLHRPGPHAEVPEEPTLGLLVIRPWAAGRVRPDAYGHLAPSEVGLGV